MPRYARFLAMPLLIVALAGCHAREQAADTATTSAAEGSDALPKPASAGGPVTGMPARPGPGPVGPPAAASVETVAVPTVDATQDATSEAGAPDAASAPVAPSSGDDTTTAAEPTSDDAVAVVRAYYAALAAHDATRAGTYWAQGARPAAPAGVDADTTTLTADIGAPGRMDAAAGSRYLRVPVTVARTLRDGSVVRSSGMVTLRRAVVDGATPEQRAWRIVSADLVAAPSP